MVKTRILILVGLCMMLFVTAYAMERSNVAQNLTNRDKEYLVPPYANAGWDIVTYLGNGTYFEGIAQSRSGKVMKCEWDFDGDGKYDWSSPMMMLAFHVYDSEGIYRAVFKVTDENDLSWSDTVEVTVKSGKGTQRFIKPVASKPPSYGKALKTKDGTRKKYAILLGQSSGEDWTNVQLFYQAFNQTLGIDSSDIYVLFSNGLDPDSANPDHMIDYEGTVVSLDTVFYRLTNEDQIDADDYLFIMICGHGEGWYGGNGHIVATDASVQEGDEPDILERDFVHPDWLWHPLGTWFATWGYSQYYYREKYVSHFTNVHFDSVYWKCSDTTITDNDIWIEKFHDYLAGDLNHDGIIDTSAGEVFDFDHDGIPPYNPQTGSYDEDDWGDIDMLYDDYWTTFPVIPQHACCLFDSGLDNTCDIDVDYDSFPIAPHVDGTDTNNDGSFDGVDMNSDGDKDDWVSIDEVADLNGPELFDDHLAELLNSLGDPTIMVCMNNCLSGGFIWDLRGSKRVIMTQCNDIEISWGSGLLRAIADAISSPSLADSLDIDGCASMAEVFNYADAADHYNVSQYDDNGDGLGHAYPVPDSGDGAFGRVTFFDECSTSGYLLYHSHQAKDSVYNKNGVVNPGDTIHMSVVIEHTGLTSAIAYSVTCTLKTDNPYVNFINPVRGFGNIDSGDTAVSNGYYIFNVSSSCPDSELIEFHLYAYTGDTLAGVSTFYQMVLKQDFVLFADPETLIVYVDSEEKSKGGAGAGGIGYGNSFKIIALPLGGFNYQLTLSAIDDCPDIGGVLRPNKITPPDTITMGLFFAMGCPPQICSTLVVTATGGGITHKDTLVVAIRQAPPNPGPVWYVDTSGNDLYGNGTEGWPFRTIKWGIQNASPGDTVLVNKGVYQENIVIEKDSLVVASHYVRNQEESYIDSTIIDGLDSGWVVSINACDEATLCGFTIRNGIPTSEGYGGGVYCNDATPHILQNIIKDNAKGLKINAVDSIYVSRNRISDNVSDGISVEGSYSFQIVNNTVSYNGGSGIFYNNCNGLLKNNIVTRNDYYGIYKAVSGAVDIKYSDVWGNAGGNYHGTTDTTGCISINPMFVDSLNRDYHLTCASFCIDAGDPNDPVPPGGGSRIDMGAFEFQYPPLDTICGDVNHDQCINDRDVDYLIKYLYYQGPAPDPLWIGDVNCDSLVTGADIVYLNNYLHHGGPAPCANCK
jgi:parallel beta-helix repeat protein